MKSLFLTFLFIGFGSQSFAFVPFVCEMRSQNELSAFNINRDGLGGFEMKNGNQISVMIVKQSVRIELDRPATLKEIANAAAYGKTITTSPLAYTQVNLGQTVDSAVLMADGTRITCRQTVE